MKSGKTIWPVIRTLLFLLIGLMNTFLIRTEDIGSWKNYAGYLFLALALIDGSLLIYKYLKTTK